MYKISMVSLGCPKNQVDAEQMLYSLKQAGFEIGVPEAEADAIIINTCGFIEDAKSEAIEKTQRNGFYPWLFLKQGICVLISAKIVQSKKLWMPQKGL